jgi:hypothetical protein
MCKCRRRRMFVLLLFSVMLLNPACKGEPSYEEIRMNSASAAAVHPVQIRIKNASQMDFDRVRVVFPDRVEVDYGPVAKDGFSDFHGTSRAYRYVQLRVKAGDQEFVLTPMDFVGEQELAPGRYTYILRVDGSRLTMDLEKAD